MKPIYTCLLLFVAFFLFFGCVSEPLAQASAAGPTYTCPDGSVVADVSRCPQIVPSANIEPLQAHYEPGEVTKRCDEAILKANNTLNEIASRSANEANKNLLDFENTMANFSEEVSQLYFTGYAYPDAEISSEGFECEEKIWAFSTVVITRKDIYNAIKGCNPVNEAEKRLCNITVANFEQNGLALPDGKLAYVRALMQNISSLETLYSQNLNLDNKTIEFTIMELDGAPQDFLGRLDRAADGKYIVTMKYPDYDAVMQNVKNAETRKRMNLAFYNRGAEEGNVGLLEEAIILREELAGELGFATWADYKTSMRMAKNASNVEDFLSELKPGIENRSRGDIATLLEFKKTIEPNATEVNSWDVAYLSNQYMKSKYSLDSEKVREYFPLDGVLNGMFSIYSHLFNVSFEKAGAKAWSPEVKVYRVADTLSNETIGYIYFDLFPRSGKYGHEAMFPMAMEREVDGKRNVPIAVIIANKNPPSAGKPALLSHNEVINLFHEFGHALHVTLSEAPYASLSGTSVAWDFVETPSQTLENWPTEREVIVLLSRHYADSSPMAAGMLDSLIASQDFGQGIMYANLLARSQIDMDYHTASGPVNASEVANSDLEEIIGLKPVEGNSYPASFGHVMGGYDAGYYSYLWSQVYALDCFSQFQKNGLNDQATGIRFRETILSQGDMKDGGELLYDFLGREPSSDALFEKLNVSGG